MTDVQKERVVIVVFMGFHNASENKKVIRMVETNFRDSLMTGGIQVVQPDISIYPNFSKITRRNFNDSLQRVHWRTKQNIDFAYMFGYCERLSDYYLHVEDDVEAVRGYITKIEAFLSMHEKSQHLWFVLEFGEGFIGKFFRSRDLCTLKTYLLLFQDEKPGDLLLNDLKIVKSHDFKNVKRGRKLFRHLGKFSSLQGKMFEIPNFSQKFKQKSFPGISRFKTNPPAIIKTSMNSFLYFTPERAYERTNSVYFWAKTPQVGDYYRVILKDKVLSSRVTILTGTPVTGKDRLDYAQVYINNKITFPGMCRSRSLGKLFNGMFEHRFSVPEELKCLEMVVTQSQTQWVRIYQINIETLYI